MIARSGFSSSLIVVVLLALLLAAAGALQLSHRERVVAMHRERARHRCDRLARAAVAEALFQLQTWVNDPTRSLPGERAGRATWFQLVRRPPGPAAGERRGAVPAEVRAPQAAELAGAEGAVVSPVDVRLLKLSAPGGLLQGVLQASVTVRGADGTGRRLVEQRRFRHLVHGGGDPAVGAWTYTRCRIDGRPLGRVHASF